MTILETMKVAFQQAGLRWSYDSYGGIRLMNQKCKGLIILIGVVLSACGTPASQFGVYQQSDGTVGIHAPKSATQEETQAAAEKECKKLGKRTAMLAGSRETVNDRFPMTYLYRCIN